MADRILGPNMLRLMSYKVARDLHPPGSGGIGAAMNNLRDALVSDRMADINRQALEWCDQAIEVMRSAPDNPYGDDEETIAGAIVAELEKPRSKRVK